MKKRNRILEEENPDLASRRSVLREGDAPKMMYPLVVDLAAEGVAVVASCRVLGFSTQAFYKWRKRPWSDSEWHDAHLINELVDLHADDPEFRYRFLHDELVAAGQQAGANRVHRLCRQNQLRSVFAKKKGLGRKAGALVHDDLVKRHFKADAPDVVWLTDITEHWTDEGKLYMCALKDVCSGRIVGHALGARMTSQLAVRALDNAVIGRNYQGTIVHSDRGSQVSSVPGPSLPVSSITRWSARWVVSAHAETTR